MPPDGYDIIGDVHGHADELEALLKRMGYGKKNGSYRCAGRMALFVGDLIDRGRHNLRTTRLVRAMVEDGNALCVMGNHEYNALCFHTRDPQTGAYLRPHDEKNIKQHKAVINEVADDPGKLQEMLDWFITLPVCLDLGHLRLVHACWHPELIEALGRATNATYRFGHATLAESARKGSGLYRATETVLKGTETPLPPGCSFPDKEGHIRYEIRTPWWRNEPAAFRETPLYPETVRRQFPDSLIPEDSITGYPNDAAPVFFGHYWLTPPIRPFAENICCTDYSVAKQGRLCCYRWDGEDRLSEDKFVTVDSRY